jgi:parallel beta-helix repeat protein
MEEHIDITNISSSYIFNSYGIYFKNNTIKERNIHIYKSNGCILTKNIFMDVIDNSIIIELSFSILFNENIIINSKKSGISIYQSYWIKIEYNNITGGLIGIFIDESRNNEISYNNITQNNICISIEKANSEKINHNNLKHSLSGIDLFVKSGGKSINARNNWWGNCFGPFLKVNGVPLRNCFPWSFKPIS